MYLNVLVNLKLNTMKNRSLSIAVIFTMAFTMITPLLIAQKDASVEIMKANDNFMNLFNAGDADKFVTVYTEDARLLPPNGEVVTGRNNIKTFWEGMMKAGIKPVLKTVSAQRYGKTVIEEGTVAIHAGDKVVDNVKYMVIWKKVKGVWKMHQDIWNSNNPLPN